jgi:hypothetical protein
VFFFCEIQLWYVGWLTKVFKFFSHRNLLYFFCRWSIDNRTMVKLFLWAWSCVAGQPITQPSFLPRWPMSCTPFPSPPRTVSLPPPPLPTQQALGRDRGPRAPLMAEETAALEASSLDKPQPREAAVDEETRALIVPDAADLPALPPSAVEANFARYFVAGNRLNLGLDWWESF